MTENSNVYARLGKNIKDLRNSYGESIVDLAFAVGLKSPSAITNYEKGSRIPECDILHKIAIHYKITADELLNGDFSDLNLGLLPINDKKKLQEISDTILPIICSEEALADLSFKKGYELHIYIYEKLKVGIEYGEDEYTACLDAYSKSLDENDTPEAAANMIWWLTFCWFGIANGAMLDSINDLTNKRISKSDFFKYQWLKDCNEELFDEAGIKQEREKQEFLEQNEEIFLFLLNVLSSSLKWRSLAEYYSALRYLVGVVNNHRSDESNRAIGEEMMHSIANMGNPYAITFLKKGIENKIL